MDLSKHWTLRRLAFLCQGEVIQGNLDLPVKAVSIDTRKISKGDLYWAIEGARLDGNRFVAEAVKAGAAAAVVSRPLEPGSIPKDFPLVEVRKGWMALGRFAEAHRLKFHNLKVIGITGSNGKTTTKEMCAAVLSQIQAVFAAPGNFNNEVGCPLSMLEITDKHRFAVLELAARKPGDIEYLSQLVHPDISILTNIGPAHLETMGSMQRIWETKSEILRGMNKDGTVIYWGEDTWLKNLADLGLPQKLIRFGFTDQAEIQGKIISMSPEGMEVEVFAHGKPAASLSLKTIGQGNALNALAAFACGMACGVPAQKISAALNAFTPVSMRGEKVDLDRRVFSAGHVVIQDAYNANPASMADSVCSFLKAYKNRRRIVVLGSMHELGADSAALHRQTAQTILSAFGNNGSKEEQAVFIVVGTGPAQEMAKALMESPLRGGVYQVYHETRTAALTRLKKLLSEDSASAVLFKASRAEAFEDFVSELKKVI